MITRALLEGIFESDVVKLIREFIKPDSVYFDIGANIGLLSVPFLNTEGINIYSFEPSPEAFAYLHQTHAQSGSHNWHIYELALGKESGKSSFQMGGPTDTAFSGLKATGRAEAREIEVKVQTLDQIWQDATAPQVSVIKLDVEGGEMDVLRGGEKCIRTCKPVIIIEIDPHNFIAYDETVQSIFTYINDMNYNVFVMPDYQSKFKRFQQLPSAEALQLNLRYEINYFLVPRTIGVA